MKKYLILLKNRNYCLYITGQIVSRFSDGLFKLAFTWALVDTTGSIKPVAIMLVMSYLPQLLVGFWGGTLIDMFDRKKIMVLSECISAAAIFLLLGSYLLHIRFLLVLYIIRFFLSLMDVFYSPAAMAYIPKIVGRENLLTANSFYAAVKNVANVASLALATVLVVTIDLSNIILINALAYVFSGLMILIIPVDGRVAPDQRNGERVLFNFASFKKAINYILGNKFVIQFALLLLLANIAYDMIYSMPALFAKVHLETSAFGFGIIEIATSLGMILGAVTVGAISLKKAGISFAISAIGGSVILVLIPLNHSLYYAVFLYFIYAGLDALSIPCFAYLQLCVKENLKGWVFAIFDTVVLFSAPFSALLMYYVVDEIGITFSYMLAAAILLLAGIFSFSLKAFRSADLRDMEKL